MIPEEQNEKFHFEISNPPKGFKYSKNKRIRKKQRKKHKIALYKGCIVTGIDIGYQEDFVTITEMAIINDKTVILNSRRY